MEPHREPRDLALVPFLATWWRELFGVDGRVWRTLGLALRRPGTHIARHLNGRSDDLISPIRFYLAVNLLFFLLLPIFNSETLSIWSFTLDSLSGLPPSSTATAEAEMAGWPAGEAAYRAVFDERVASSQAVYLVLVIPLIAVPLWLLLRGRRRYLVEHLLHVTGLLTFALLAMMGLGIAVLATRVAAWLGMLSTGVELGVQALLLLAWVIWLTIGVEGASRRVYGLRPWWSVPVAGFTLVLFALSSWLYGKALFWYTVLTLH